MTLFELFGRIAINNSDANKEIDETTTKAESSQGKINRAFTAVGKGTLAAGKIVGGAAVAIGGALIATTENTREYRTEMGKLETAFTSAGHSSEAAKNTYSELNAVLGDSGQAVEASTHLAKLVENEEELSTWTTICTGVYATFGASLPIEGLTEAANETAKTGTLTGGLADALNWAGVSEEEFQTKLDACSTEQERNALITETLNGLYSDAAETYKTVNADVIEAEKAQGRLNDAMALVGETCEPIMTGVKNAIATAVEAAVPIITTLIETFGTVVDKALAIYDTVAEYFPIIQETILTTFENAKTWITEKIEAARDAVDNAVKKIKGFLDLKKLKEDVIKKFEEMKTGIKEKIEFARDKVDQSIQEIKGFLDLGTLKENVLTKFEEIKTGIGEKLEGAKTKVSSAIENIKGFFNFSWNLPKIKMPHFKKIGETVLGLPKIGVEWYAKGAVLNRATAFDVNQATGNLMVGGEAGPEAVAPIDVLQKYVAEAVASQNGGIISVISACFEKLFEILEAYLPEMAKPMVLDTGVLVAQTVDQYDEALGQIIRRKER